MRSERPWYRKKRFIIPAVVILACLTLVAWYRLDTRVTPPPLPDRLPLNLAVAVPDTGLYTCSGSWLQQSTSGLWEMYVQGSPLERGIVNGKLTKDLIDEQETAFVDRIREMIPSPSYLKFLRYFIYWFNRDLDEYITDEYKQEIYGISLSASHDFDFIGQPYQRMMNYHSAHDIGHALQDLALVGCTSFGVWDTLSEDGSLLIGRNFDFYMGEAFARNKIVCFVRPDKGIPFMTVTWAGMTGAVSGMNLSGLTVTINAAKSEIPMSARTPISLVAREILQYASTIDEAFAIAKQRETFVSESLLIGSAADHRAAIIEKAPSKLSLYAPEGGMVVCSNHYQSETFAGDKLNRKNIRESSSAYRYRRMKELVEANYPVSVADAAAILRNRDGLNNAGIGMGNEMAVNQLIAHHSVIFQPEQRLVWVSAGPWQSGPYICYDLNKIFHTFAALHQRSAIEEAGLNIPPDPFLGNTDYVKFLQYKAERDSIRKWLKAGEPVSLPAGFTGEFLSLNPELFEAYSLAGDLAEMNRDDASALMYYGEALKKQIPELRMREEIILKMSRNIYRNQHTRR